MARLVSMGRLIFLGLQVAKATDVENRLICSLSNVLALLGAAAVLETITYVVEGHVFRWYKVNLRFLLLLV